jgi:hypothetical protein
MSCLEVIMSHRAALVCSVALSLLVGLAIVGGKDRLFQFHPPAPGADTPAISAPITQRSTASTVPRAGENAFLGDDARQASGQVFLDQDQERGRAHDTAEGADDRGERRLIPGDDGDAETRSVGEGTDDDDMAEEWEDD